MTWLIVLLTAIAAASLLLLVFAAGLTRVAAGAERDELSQLEEARASAVANQPSVADASTDDVDRRTGQSDRRGPVRPWSEAAPGRRSEDAVRRELEEAETALEEAEAQAETRVAAAETRRAAGQ